MYLYFNNQVKKIKRSLANATTTNDNLLENAYYQLDDHFSISLSPPSLPIAIGTSPTGEGAEPPFPPWGK